MLPKLPKYLTWPKVIILLIFSFGALLQLYYPFNNLPIDDSARDGLQATTVWIVDWAGLTGTIYLMLIVFIFALFSFLRIIFSVVMYFNPAFKAKVAERRAAKRARIQELEAAGKRRSRRSIGIEVVINCLFSVAWILNDAVFNRPEGTAIVDGAKARVIHNIALCAVVVPIECLVFSLFIFIAVIFKVRRARKGQIKLQGDEELMVGVPTQEMAQVPSMKEGFEEKLIEIDDSVERFEEKMSKEERTEIDN